MNERLKEARKIRGFSQKQLAEAIGVTPSFITQLEHGRSNPIGRTLKGICDVLSINEEWLVNGTGEMFVTKTREEEIFDLVTSLMVNSPESTKLRMVSIILKYPEDEWEMLYELAKKFFSE